MEIIPKSNADGSNFPCWLAVTNTKGEDRRPHIKCKCGQITSIGNHHIHKDGTVTASYFHSNPPMPGGCGWHVYLKLDDYNGIEWPPGRSEQELLKDFD